MSITPLSYATAEDYRKMIKRNDPSQDAEILEILTAMSRGIDNELGRFFGKTDELQERVYVLGDDVYYNNERLAERGYRGQYFQVDDIATDDGIEIKFDEKGDGRFDNETALDENDFELLPRNAQKGPEEWPFTQVSLTPWGNAFLFGEHQRVQIKAIFGWPEVPVAIKHAVIQLAGIWRLESPRATTRVPELTEVTEASPEARMIILRLREKYGRRLYG